MRRMSRITDMFYSRRVRSNLRRIEKLRMRRLGEDGVETYLLRHRELPMAHEQLRHLVQDRVISPFQMLCPRHSLYVRQAVYVTDAACHSGR